MGVSLGDLHYTLGVDESQLDAQLAKAQQKIAQALIDPSITKANLALALKSAAVDAKRAIETERLARANLANAKAADVNARSQAALNNANLTGVGIAQRNTQAQQTLHNSTAISNNAALTSAQRLIIAQNQATASHSRVTTAANAAARSQQNLARHSGVTSRAFVTQRGIALQLASTLGGAFTIAGIAAFIKQLATVSGEFELQRVSLRAITRDKEAADKIFSQVKTLSVQSPFTFQNLLRDTKQLAAFSVETDKLFGTMTRLADVSAGLGIDMDRIILAYGQVRAATVLRGQELRQFTEAGIPIIDKLAEKFGKLENRVVSAGEVFEKISNRMVSFKMVDEIFTDLTASGGMFFEMQKKQSETLIGKLRNLTDAYQIMLSSIGESQSGNLKSGVDLLTSIMRNWESIVNVLKVVITAYGSYKAIMFGVNLVDKYNNAIRREQLALMAASSTRTTFMSASIARASVSTNVLSRAMTGLNSTMKANVWVLAASAIAAIGVALYDAYTDANKLKVALSEIFSETSKESSTTILNMENLMGKLKDVNMYSGERAEIIAKLNSSYGQYLTNLIQEGDSYDVITEKMKGTRQAILENAKAKIYSASVTAIESNVGEKMTAAEAGVKSGLKGTIGLYGNKIKLTSTEASEFFNNVFEPIRKSKALQQNASEIQKLVTNELSKAFKARGIVPSEETLRLGFAQFNKVYKETQSYADALKEMNSELDKAESSTANLTDSGLTPLGKELANINIKYKSLEDQINAIGRVGGEEFANEQKRAELFANETERLKARAEMEDMYGKKEDARTTRRLNFERDPKNSLAGNINLAVMALEGFDKANLKLFANIDSKKSESEIYDGFAESINSYKDALDREEKKPSSLGGTPEKIAQARQMYEINKRINDMLGIEGKAKSGGTTKEDPTEKLARSRKDAMDKLNEQYLKDHEDFANYDMGIEAGRIANMENSINKEMMLNESAFQKREADIVKLRQLRLDELNAAAGIKKGAKNEISSLSDTKGISAATAGLPEAERGGFSTAVATAIANEKQMILNNEKDKADGIIAINRDWAYKIKEIQRDVNDAFLYGIERERAALNEKYDDWAKKAKLAGANTASVISLGTPASDLLPAVEAQKTADILVEIESKRLKAMAELDNRFAMDQLDFQTEIEYKKNELRAAGSMNANKLERLNFQTFQNNLTRKINLARASTDQSVRDTEPALQTEKDLSIQNEAIRKRIKLTEDVSKVVSGITSELVRQGMLSEEQGAAIENTLDGFKALASGDFIGAAVNIASQIASLFPSQAEAFQDRINKINIALKEQQRLIDLSSRVGGGSDARVKELEVLKEKLKANEEALIKAEDRRAGKIFKIGPVYKGYVKDVEELTATVLEDKQAVEDATLALQDFFSGGVTENTLVDSISQAFQDGKGAVDDFGEYTNQVLRDAILENFKQNVLGDTLVNAAAQISNAFKDRQLTAEEIAGIRTTMADATVEAKAKWDALTSAFPEMFTADTTAKGGLQGEIKGIKEDTAQLLASLLNAVRGDVSLQNISLKSIEGILSNTGSATANSLAQLVKIESNTYGMFMAFKEVMGGKGSLGTGIRVTLMN